jgi:hypothetical protein
VIASLKSNPIHYGIISKVIRARILVNINSNKKSNVMNFTGADDISDNATPTIFVSGDTEKLGLITGINLAASSMFGYNKSELLSIFFLNSF